MTSSVARTLYKQLLKQARAFDHCLEAKGLSIIPEMGKMTIPDTTVLTGPLDRENPKSAEYIVKQQFRTFRHWTAEEDLQELFSISFRALRVMHNRTKALASNDYSSRPANLKYHVGQVAVHRLHGYKCVIFGWDEKCQQPEEWVAQMGVQKLKRGTVQPFYHCLVDVRDRRDAAITYVAEDNILPVQPETPVHHPLVEHFFSQFVPSRGYIPEEFTHYEYPEDSCTAFSLEEVDVTQEELPPDEYATETLIHEMPERSTAEEAKNDGMTQETLNSGRQRSER